VVLFIQLLLPPLMSHFPVADQNKTKEMPLVLYSTCLHFMGHITKIASPLVNKSQAIPKCQRR
jgi:hypothetical protein